MIYAWFHPTTGYFLLWAREVGANPLVSWEKKQFHIDNAATVKLHLAFADKSVPVTKEFSTPQAICAVHWTSESHNRHPDTFRGSFCSGWRAEGITVMGGQKVWMVTLHRGKSFRNRMRNVTSYRPKNDLKVFYWSLASLLQRNKLIEDCLHFLFLGFHAKSSGSVCFVKYLKNDYFGIFCFQKLILPI